jgi:hypothetical protein
MREVKITHGENCLKVELPVSEPGEKFPGLVRRELIGLAAKLLSWCAQEVDEEYEGHEAYVDPEHFVVEIHGEWPQLFEAVYVLGRVIDEQMCQIILVNNGKRFVVKDAEFSAAE